MACMEELKKFTIEWQADIAPMVSQMINGSLSVTYNSSHVGVR
jgi:hypothetical protein